MKPSKFMKIVAMLLSVVLIWQSPMAFASKLSDLKEEQKDVEQKVDDLNESIKDKKQAISSNEDKQTKILDQISEIGKKIDSTNTQIDEVNKKIDKANAEIKVLNNEIKELQNKIDERTALLEERARAIQVSGNVSYIDVLLGANSFVDFIDRFSAVTTLLDADRKIMREQKEDILKLEDQQVKLENTKKELEDDKASLTKLKSSLSTQQKEKNNLVNELEAQQKKLQSQKKLLEEEYSEALQVSKELDKKISNEQARIAEIARKEAERKAAAAKAAAAKAAAAQNSSSGSSSNASVGSAPEIQSGTWTRPTTGRFTSPFGWRNIGAGPEFHYGVDIANATGTPIVSANDGVVSYAGALSSYGNVIMITHYVNGSVWTTVYAHLSSIQVSSGQSVSKGQRIGLMGSTGRSTGPHLHFEIHNGPWQSGRPYVLNPVNYINF